MSEKRKKVLKRQWGTRQLCCSMLAFNSSMEKHRSGLMPAFTAQARESGRDKTSLVCRLEYCAL